MRISDWSSDVCSSDLAVAGRAGAEGVVEREQAWLDLVDGEAGDRAGELGRDGGALAGLGAGLGAALGVPRLRFLGEGEAAGEAERRLAAVGPARLAADPHHQAVRPPLSLVVVLILQTRGGSH